MGFSVIFLNPHSITSKITSPETLDFCKKLIRNIVGPKSLQFDLSQFTDQAKLSSLSFKGVLKHSWSAQGKTFYVLSKIKQIW